MLPVNRGYENRLGIMRVIAISEPMKYNGSMDILWAFFVFNFSNIVMFFNFRTLPLVTIDSTTETSIRENDTL